MTRDELIEALMEFAEKTGTDWTLLQEFDDSVWIRFEVELEEREIV